MASSWEDEIELAPVFLRRCAFGRPVGRVIELVRHLRGPEAADVAVEDVAFDRLAESGGSARLIRLPAWREDERAAEREMRLRLLRRPLLEGDNVFCRLGRVDDALSFAVDRLQMIHRFLVLCDN